MANLANPLHQLRRSGSKRNDAEKLNEGNNVIERLTGGQHVARMHQTEKQDS
jgi:hypothetical protein